LQPWQLKGDLDQQCNGVARFVVEAVTLPVIRAPRSSVELYEDFTKSGLLGTYVILTI
jgi:hypothetical protein